jgi:hypothetical protein
MFMRQGKLDRVAYVMLGRVCRQFVFAFDFLSAMLMRQGKLDCVAYVMLKLFIGNFCWLPSLVVYLGSYNS